MINFYTKLVGFVCQATYLYGTHYIISGLRQADVFRVACKAFFSKIRITVIPCNDLFPIILSVMNRKCFSASIEFAIMPKLF